MQNNDNFKQFYSVKKKNAVVKVNFFNLQTTQRKGKKGGGCTGEKPVHAETYIFRHIMRLGRWGGAFYSLSDWKISLSLFSHLTWSD